MLNIISVDVEDYFDPTEIQSYITMQDWETLAPRVEQATRRTLELFARHNTRGTFFILGWVARRYPSLIREIAAAGHEIGSHSYRHASLAVEDVGRFRSRVAASRRLLEDLAGAPVLGFRAPLFSLTPSTAPWALEALAVWAERWSPSVSLDPSGEGLEGLFLDATGGTHLFDGEAALMAQMRARLAEAGIPARLAMGPTPGSAWALARWGQGNAAPIAREDDVSEALADLPVEALRVDERTLTAARVSAR